MDKLLGLLTGKRTYLSAFVTIVLVGVYSLGYINDAIFEASVVFFGSLGLISLRLAVKKAEK